MRAAGLTPEVSHNRPRLTSICNGDELKSDVVRATSVAAVGSTDFVRRPICGRRRPQDHFEILFGGGVARRPPFGEGNLVGSGQRVHDLVPGIVHLNEYVAALPTNAEKPLVSGLNTSCSTPAD